MLSAKPWQTDTVVIYGAAQGICYGLGILAAGILQQVGGPFFQSAGFGPVLISSLSFQGVTWILAFLFLRSHELDWRNAFGLRGPQLRRALIMAVLVTGIILPVALLLQKASANGLTRIGWEPRVQNAVQSLVSVKTWWGRLYFGFFAVVCAPVAEEFIFRGVLYPFIKQQGYPRFACIFVSFVFASIHMNLQTFIPLFVLAMAWTWLYEETDNLLAPIVAHSLFNAANLVALYFLNWELS